MKDEIIVKRYTQGYIAAAGHLIGMDRIVSDMRSIRDYLRKYPDLMVFLKAPNIPLESKKALIHRIFSDVLARETRVFINYLIEKRREDCLVGITDFVRVAYSHGDVVDVNLCSTYPLELEDIQRLKQALARRIGKMVNLYLKFDPDLLGGMQITIGNRIIDGSVRNKLKELKRVLMKAQVS